MEAISDHKDEHAFDRLAWEKAFAKGQFIDQPIHPELPKYSKKFESHGVKRILDLGCGSGRHTVFLAKSGFEVFGLDIAPTGLCATIEKLAKEGLSAHVTLSDMQVLPYDDAFFDTVISVSVIHHNRLQDIQETVSEIWRVLRPQGLVWVTVPIPKDHPSKRGVEIEPGTFVPSAGCEKGLPHHLFTEKELVELFNRFSILDLHVHAWSHHSLLAEKRHQ